MLSYHVWVERRPCRSEVLGVGDARDQCPDEEQQRLKEHRERASMLALCSANTHATGGLRGSSRFDGGVTLEAQKKRTDSQMRSSAVRGSSAIRRKSHPPRTALNAIVAETSKEELTAPTWDACE